MPFWFSIHNAVLLWETRKREPMVGSVVLDQGLLP